MKLTIAQELIEQNTGLTQRQAEQLALMFFSKPEGENEERMVKALTLLERMLTNAQADVTLISILLNGDATFDLSENQTELLFKITDKGQRAVELTSLLDDTEDGLIQ